MIIKVDKSHILNEEGFAIGPIGYNNAGFSYAVKPLSTNLSQQGNDNSPKAKNKSFKIFKGDNVKGYCPYDKKIHKGLVKYLYYIPNSDETKPLYVYIQDFENNTIIPITADSASKCKYNYPQPQVKSFVNKHGSEIDYDLQKYSPVEENKKFDFNKSLL